jgi:hypothetical protein
VFYVVARGLFAKRKRTEIIASPLSAKIAE